MIKKQITYERTIEYYEGIQLFEARDPIGGTYVASYLGSDEAADKYLLVGCEPEKLGQFRNGSIDLKTLMVMSAKHGWCVADVTDFDEPFNFDPEDSDEIPDDILPKSVSFIAGAEVNHEVTKRARQSDSFTIQVRIEPREAAMEQRVRAKTLIDLIRHVQTLTSHAVEQVAKEEQEATGTRRRSTGGAHLLDAVDLSHGSTVITLQAANKPTPHTDFLLSRAMGRLDELLKNADAPEATLAALERYDPKLTKSFGNLMKFLIRTKTGFSYTWADSRSSKPSHHAISMGSAEALSRRLEDVSELEGDERETDECEAKEVILQGILEMADEPKSIWRLRDHQQGVREGTVEQDGPRLSLLVIDRPYRFECVEKRPSAFAKSRRGPTLYLQHWDEL